MCLIKSSIITHVPSLQILDSNMPFSVVIDKFNAEIRRLNIQLSMDAPAAQVFQ